MKTARLIERAFKDFDKLSKDLDKIQVVAFKEIDKNNSKITRISDNYYRIIQFLNNTVEKLSRVSSHKRSALFNKNDQIKIDAKRALRVKERITDLLK